MAEAVKKYQIIYADPPWEYEDKALAGLRGACCKYPVLNLNNLKALPVAQLADRDCVLFLWATMPKLNEVFPLLEAWGFAYKTVAFTWVKRNRNSMGWFWGMGRWTRSNAELCLLATIGHPPRRDAGIHSVVDTPIMGHSRKPDEVVRDRIVALCGDLPRIELFARRKVEGWDCWGNEVESDIELYPDFM